ncbi:MAG TPA: beta-L-arabinofuranosidase domain-containing protein [Ramlibacter sp.]|jgi:hypothetical protein
MPLLALPLGSVRATGWLAHQMQLQADGMTGHAEEVIPELGPDSAWRGGTGENWEKGPYYMRGLISLAYVGGDKKLRQQAVAWVEAILGSQTADGQIGPRSNEDWWPRMVVTWALREYQEATGDERVIPTLLRYARFMRQHIEQKALDIWAKARAADQIATFFWLYNRTGEGFLLELADILEQQANDWPNFFRTLTPTESDFHATHAVNISQALKYPAVVYQRSGADADKALFWDGWNNLRDAHGLNFGMWSGTEAIAGHSDSQGVELCSIVEQLLSNAVAVQSLFDARIGDEQEKIAFNLLSAATSKDFKQYQYYTLPNIPTAKRNRKGALPFRDDHGDDLLLSAHAGFHCCCYNLHMGWPKYVQHSWMASQDGGLVAFAHGPTSVETVSDGVTVTVAQTGNYPFEDELRFEVTPSAPKRFPLYVRIPGWSRAPRVAVNGEPLEGVTSGSFLRIEREWQAGDVVTAYFPKALAVLGGVTEAKSVWYGPLVFSLRIEEVPTIIEPRPDGFDDMELAAATPWNYALELDPKNQTIRAQVERGPMPDNPWQPDQTPISLLTKVRRMPTWQLSHEGSLAADVPPGPVDTIEPTETVRLVPCGTQTLRITAFPWLLGTKDEPPRH